MPAATLTPEAVGHRTFSMYAAHAASSDVVDTTGSVAYPALGGNRIGMAQSIAQPLGTTADEWLGDVGQLRLFATPASRR